MWEKEGKEDREIYIEGLKRVRNQERNHIC
jgi:hypothetical protein